jgi:hypothetical protein
MGPSFPRAVGADQADEGVGCGPGGPPHKVSKLSLQRSAHGPTGPPKVMKTLSTEKNPGAQSWQAKAPAPLWRCKGSRFRGAGAFACQPISQSFGPRLQRSDA